MYSGTLAIPVARSRVEAVCRVLVSDHSGVAGDQQVAEDPHQRRSGRHQGQARISSAGEPTTIALPCVRRPGPRCAAAARPGTASRAPRSPRLRAQQPGERQQREHRRAGRAAGADSTSSAAEHEQQVRDVDVRAHAVGEHRHARQEEQRRECAGCPPEPGAPQLRRPPSRTRTAPGRPSATVTFIAACGPSGASTSAEQLEQRVRGRSDRHAVGGRLPARELPAPARARRACRS